MLDLAEEVWGSNPVNDTHSPLPELLVEQPVREALPADPDPLENTITPQLVEDKVGVNDSWLLQLIGDDASDKVGRGVAKSCHQVVQRLFVHLGHCGELAACTRE